MDLSIEIRSRKSLLSSAGSEFDLDLTISAAERLKISRANVKESLGLGSISGMEDLEKELVKDEDLAAGCTNSKTKIDTSVPVDLEKLSARERIAMKRKARLNSQPNKQLKPDPISISSASPPDQIENNFESIESDALWFCERMKEKLLK